MAIISEQIGEDLSRQVINLTQKQMELISKFIDKMLENAEKKKERDLLNKIINHKKSGGLFNIYDISLNGYPVLAEALKIENIPVIGYNNQAKNTKMALVRDCDSKRVDEIIQGLKDKGRIYVYGDVSAITEKKYLFNPGDKAIKISNFTENECNCFIEKANHRGDGFTVARQKEENSSYTLYIRPENGYKESLIKKNDVITSFINSVSSLYGVNAVEKDHAIEFDQHLQQACVDYCKNPKNKANVYLVSASNKNRFIELNKDGFTVYTKGKDNVYRIKSEVKSSNSLLKNLLEKEYMLMNDCVLVDEEKYNGYIMGNEKIESKRPGKSKDLKVNREREKEFIKRLIDETKKNYEYSLAERKMSLSSVSQVENISAFFNSSVSIGGFLEHEHVNSDHIEEERELIKTLQDRFNNLNFEEIVMTKKEITKKSFDEDIEYNIEDFDLNNDDLNKENKNIERDDDMVL